MPTLKNRSILFRAVQATAARLWLGEGEMLHTGGGGGGGLLFGGVGAGAGAGVAVWHVKYTSRLKRAHV